jgi:general secretion pathway protein G
MNRPRWLRKAEFVLLAVLSAAVLMLASGNVRHRGMRRAKESVLKNDLQTMRLAINKYGVDNQHLPQSLQNLVDEGYLRQIPVNPITYKIDWVPHYVNCDLGGGMSLVCIKDIHASVGQTGSNGRPYSEW